MVGVVTHGTEEPAPREPLPLGLLGGRARFFAATEPGEPDRLVERLAEPHGDLGPGELLGRHHQGTGRREVEHDLRRRDRRDRRVEIGALPVEREHPELARAQRELEAGMPARVGERVERVEDEERAVHVRVDVAGEDALPGVLEHVGLRRPRGHEVVPVAAGIVGMHVVVVGVEVPELERLPAARDLEAGPELEALLVYDHGLGRDGRLEVRARSPDDSAFQREVALVRDEEVERPRAHGRGVARAGDGHPAGTPREGDEEDEKDPPHVPIMPAWRALREVTNLMRSGG